MRMRTFTWLAVTLAAVTAHPLLADEPTTGTAAPAVTPAPAPGESAAAAEDTNCLKATGSHIPPKDGGCLHGPGRVITREQIEHSGATTAADAVRRLTTY